MYLKDETLEETGWKLVHGDVFRPPHRPKLLAAFIGSGIQLFCVTFIVIGNLQVLLLGLILVVPN